MTDGSWFRDLVEDGGGRMAHPHTHTTTPRSRGAGVPPMRDDDDGGYKYYPRMRTASAVQQRLLQEEEEEDHYVPQCDDLILTSASFAATTSDTDFDSFFSELYQPKNQSNNSHNNHAAAVRTPDLKDTTSAMADDEFDSPLLGMQALLGSEHFDSGTSSPHDPTTPLHPTPPTGTTGSSSLASVRGQQPLMAPQLFPLVVPQTPDPSLETTQSSQPPPQQRQHELEPILSVHIVLPDLTTAAELHHSFVSPSAITTTTTTTTTTTSVFPVPVSWMLQREQEMRRIAKDRGISAERWNGSLLFRKWEEWNQQQQQQQQDSGRQRPRRGRGGTSNEPQPPSVVVVQLHPEKDLADAHVVHPSWRWWQPWLTDCIRNYYRTGALRVPASALVGGAEFLLALEYFGILYNTSSNGILQDDDDDKHNINNQNTSPVVVAFDSPVAYQRVKAWSVYFTHRATVAQWVVDHVQEHWNDRPKFTGTNRHRRFVFCTDAALDSAAEFYIVSQPSPKNDYPRPQKQQHIEILHGGIHATTPSSKQRSFSRRMVTSFFDCADPESPAEQQPLPSSSQTFLSGLMRDDFAAYLRHVLPDMEVSFDMQSVVVKRQGARDISCERPVLIVDYFDDDAEEDEAEHSPATRSNQAKSSAKRASLVSTNKELEHVFNAQHDDEDVLSMCSAPASSTAPTDELKFGLLLENSHKLVARVLRKVTDDHLTKGTSRGLGINSPRRHSGSWKDDDDIFYFAEEDGSHKPILKKDNVRGKSNFMLRSVSWEKNVRGGSKQQGQSTRHEMLSAPSASWTSGSSSSETTSSFSTPDFQLVECKGRKAVRFSRPVQQPSPVDVGHFGNKGLKPHPHAPSNPSKYSKKASQMAILGTSVSSSSPDPPAKHASTIGSNHSLDPPLLKRTASTSTNRFGYAPSLPCENSVDVDHIYEDLEWSSEEYWRPSKTGLLWGQSFTEAAPMTVVHTVLKGLDDDDVSVASSLTKQPGSSVFSFLTKSEETQAVAAPPDAEGKEPDVIDTSFDDRVDALLSGEEPGGTGSNQSEEQNCHGHRPQFKCRDRYGDSSLLDDPCNLFDDIYELFNSKGQIVRRVCAQQQPGPGCPELVEKECPELATCSHNVGETLGLTAEEEKAAAMFLRNCGLQQAPSPPKTFNRKARKTVIGFGDDASRVSNGSMPSKIGVEVYHLPVEHSLNSVRRHIQRNTRISKNDNQRYIKYFHKKPLSRSMSGSAVERRRQMQNAKAPQRDLKTTGPKKFEAFRPKHCEKLPPSNFHAAKKVSRGERKGFLRFLKIAPKKS